MPGRNACAPLRRWHSPFRASTSTPRTLPWDWPVFQTASKQRIELLHPSHPPLPAKGASASAHLCPEQLLLMLLPQQVVCCKTACCCQQHKQEDCLTTHVDMRLRHHTDLWLLERGTALALDRDSMSQRPKDPGQFEWPARSAEFCISTFRCESSTSRHQTTEPHLLE